MNKATIQEKASAHLHVLCSEIGERRVGSERNRKATAYAKQVLEELGWKTESTKLEVMDWVTEGAYLLCDNRVFDVFSSHYSQGCDVSGEWIPISTVEQLETCSITGKIVLLYGPIASEQIAPKNFPFWNPEEHQHLISLLEQGRPKALICATKRNSAFAGGVYPYPLFEDGDFDIPSVYMKDTEGEKLLACIGKPLQLVSKACRIPETAYNLVARKDAKEVEESAQIEHATEKFQRIVISAHIDTKIDTPGAIDNGTGVAVVLLLAELLKDACGKNPVELVIFNGEDYYGATGQVQYVAQHAGRFNEFLLNINIDGAGYKEGLTCFSPFNLPDAAQEALNKVLVAFPELTEGLPWYQSDHSLFLQNGCPAIAVSSQWLIEHIDSQEITHTPKDNLGIVDYGKVAECALGIAELVKVLLV